MDNKKLDELAELLDEIRQRINAAETQKLPYDFMSARQKVAKAQEIIKEMKGLKDE